jgi:hypothetical protein
MSYSFAILATFTHKKNKGGQVVSKLSQSYKVTFNNIKIFCSRKKWIRMQQNLSKNKKKRKEDKKVKKIVEFFIVVKKVAQM